MKHANLVLHCGANACSMDSVENAYCPEPTESHFPVPHHFIVNQVREQLEEAGMQIVHEAHALRREGQEYFGLLQVQPGNGPLWDAVQQDNDEYALVTGIRNSHIKTFSAGMAMGRSVFVCDNLSLTGTINLRRKHSRNIVRDLPGVVSRCIGQLATLAVEEEQRLEAYKDTRLSDMTVRDFVVRSMERGVIGCTLIPKVLTEWHRPRHEEFAPRTGWSLFNAYTEVLKERGLFALPDKTSRLNGMMDMQCGLSLTGGPRDAQGIEIVQDTAADDELVTA
jgi:hypothetical protein